MSSRAQSSHAVLPLSLAPIGVRRLQAAAFVGDIGGTTFDQMVADGRMPQPKLINSLPVWDVEELRLAFKALQTRRAKAERNPFDPPETEDEGHDA